MVFSVRQDSESRAGPSRAAAARRRGRGRVARRVNQELTENLHGVNIGSLTYPPGPRCHRGSGAEHFSLHRGGESCRQHVATIPHLRVARIPRGRVRGGGRADQHFRTHRGRGPGSPARHRTTGAAAASRHRRSTLMTRAGDAGPPRRENFCRIHKTLRGRVPMDDERIARQAVTDGTRHAVWSEMLDAARMTRYAEKMESRFRALHAAGRFGLLLSATGSVATILNMLPEQWQTTTLPRSPTPISGNGTRNSPGDSGGRPSPWTSR